MSSSVYDQARYYDIAFSFTNVPEQVDELFLPLIEQYSRTPVKRVLDVCCGPSVQLREFVRRGYEAVGLDICPEMLAYLAAEAAREQVAVETVQGDMLDFRLNRKADFGFILMGSIFYVGSSNAGLLAHLTAMADALNPGGLYLIENVFADWLSPMMLEPESWEMTRDGVTVKTTFQARLGDPLRQTVYETLAMDVNDNGTRQQYSHENEVKLFFPEELRSLVALHGAFEFLGYFERYKPQPLTTLTRDHNALLRRR